MSPALPGPRTRGAHVTKGFTSLAGKGHKAFWSQTQDLGHFSKSWEIGFFVWGFFAFLEKKKRKKKRERKREKDERTFAGRPPALYLPVPTLARRHHPVPQGGFLLWFRLLPALPRQALVTSGQATLFGSYLLICQTD